MCQVVFSLSDEHKHVERPQCKLSVYMRMHNSFYFSVCACLSVYWLSFSSGAEWQRTGVIGSSLSPQTGGTFHHRRISFQFSKLCNTSDAIKFFSQTPGEKNASQQLFNHPLTALWSANELPYAVRKTQG